MLILKYFVTVGLALTVGLWALSSYVESQSSARAARIHTTASLPAAPPAATVVADTDVDVMVGPHKPDKPAAKSTTARTTAQHGRDTRRSVH
jgi:hypothetical protein